MDILKNKYWLIGFIILGISINLGIPLFVTEVYTKRILQAIILSIGLALLVYGIFQKHKSGAPVNYLLLLFLTGYGIALYLLLKR